MKKHFIVLAALAFAAPAFADGNAAAGKEIATKVCAACHNLNGVSNKGQDPQPPILAGQYKDYLLQALHEYQKGERNAVVMKGMAAPLSEQDIKDLAEYLSALPGPLGTLPKRD